MFSNYIWVIIDFHRADASSNHFVCCCVVLLCFSVCIVWHEFKGYIFWWIKLPYFKENNKTDMNWGQPKVQRNTFKSGRGWNFLCSYQSTVKLVLLRYFLVWSYYAFLIGKNHRQRQIGGKGSSIEPMKRCTVVVHRSGSGIGDNLTCMEWVHWRVVCSAS